MLRKNIEIEVRDPTVDVLIQQTRLLLEEGRLLLRELRRSRDSTSNSLDAVKKMLERSDNDPHYRG